MTSYIHEENNLTIIYFYDWFIKLWTITKYNIEGHQIEDSDYFNDKIQLKKHYPQFKFIKEDYNR